MLELFAMVSIISGATSDELQPQLSPRILGVTATEISQIPLQVSQLENSKDSIFGENTTEISQIPLKLSKKKHSNDSNLGATKDDLQPLLSPRILGVTATEISQIPLQVSQLENSKDSIFGKNSTEISQIPLKLSKKKHSNDSILGATKDELQPPLSYRVPGVTANEISKIPLQVSQQENSKDSIFGENTTQISQIPLKLSKKKYSNDSILGATKDRLLSPLSYRILGVTADEIFQTPLQVSQEENSIFGVPTTKISQTPWQVSLQQYNRHCCSGSIYSKDMIVTAAHCLDDVPRKALTIRAGSDLWNSGGVVRDVASYKVHENYNSETDINNIAVIRLQKSLTFSSTIKAIPLARAEPRNGTPVLISGWGNNYFGAKYLSDSLKFLNSTIIDSINCQNPIYGYGNQIHSTMICAATSGKDAYESDSGGPMVSDGVLAGVVSWGEKCGYKDYPGVFSNVAVLKKWIDKTARIL